MGFLIDCPYCGPRSVYEFKFGGENKAQPSPEWELKDWRYYFYFNKNVNGPSDEWWYHGGGCGAWLRIKRNTGTNEVIAVERTDCTARTEK
jgi:heterotetrameric sarcosine oxidase delta subunit